MKKNKAMRAAGVLLIATMLTTCMTAGTFAKYTTTDRATDSARVAKFGVAVTANGTLFGEEYAAVDAQDGANAPIGYSANDNTGTVQVNATDQADGVKVVAPGTLNDKGLGFAVSGTPEVDVKVTFNVTKAKNIRLNAGAWGEMIDVTDFVTAENFAAYSDENGANYLPFYYSTDEEIFTKVDAANDTFEDLTSDPDNKFYQLHNNILLDEAYFPVQFSLASDGSTTYNAAGVTTDTLAEVVNAYAEAIGVEAADLQGTAGATNFDNDFQANTNLSTALGLNGAKITWAWAFETAGYNAADTVLGDLIAGDDFDGIIVYNDVAADDAPDTFEIPAAGNAEDALFDDDTKPYNLYVGLAMDLTVDQID